MAGLVELDFAGMREFMAQPPSTALCYLVGCLAEVRAKVEEMTAIVQTADELLRKGAEDLHTTQDAPYICALLWGLSQCPDLLKSSDLFDRFFRLALDALRSADGAVVSAAAYAFGTMSSRAPGLFTADSDVVAELVSEVEFFACALSPAAAIRMFQCVTRVSTDPGICQPIEVRLTGDNPDGVVLALDIIRECTPHAWPLMGSLWPQVFAIAVTMVPDRALDPSVVLSTATELLVGLDWNTAEPLIRELLGLLVTRGEATPAGFTMFAAFARKFPEMRILAEPIFQSFVVPETNPPVREIMKMIRAMKCGWVDLDWMVVAAEYVFRGWDSEAIQETVRAVVRVMREKDRAGITSLLAAYAERLMAACFSALTDGMHGVEFASYVKLVRKMSIFLSDGKPFEDDWKNLIIAQLAAVAAEPAEGLFKQFANHLSSVQLNAVEFEQAFVNLLIVLKKLAPGDRDVFSGSFIKGFGLGLGGVLLGLIPDDAEGGLSIDDDYLFL
jgi:hypothetical protein